tara:strand:+ start:108861 stop:110066 length:1206 start_codon:yes stop_codon:yes gene_type:complete
LTIGHHRKFPIVAIFKFFAILILLTSCIERPDIFSKKIDKIKTSSTSFQNIHGWNEDSHGEALKALKLSCKLIVNKSFENNQETILGIKMKSWHTSCLNALETSEHNNLAAKLFFEKWFIPHIISDNKSVFGLFTGYYEPEILGSLSRNTEFNIPLYMPPDNLINIDLHSFSNEFPKQTLIGRIKGRKVIPYYTRSEINEGVDELKGYELVWLKSSIDAFFLHIQGSGRIILRDGSKRRIGYAGRNGHPYFAIGKDLIKSGEINKKDMSMQRIREWLSNNPSLSHTLMNKNRSYIFFKWIDNSVHNNGPIGAQGIPLTAGRSLAVDRDFIPLGLPLWLETTIPNGGGQNKKKIDRLVISQDTGSAIKGIVRGDLFIGTGKDSGEIAGLMNEKGRYWILLPK